MYVKQNKTGQRPKLKRTVHTLLTPEQLNAAMGRESARVDRKAEGELSLVLFRVAGSKNKKFSAIRLAHTILKRLRVTDDVGWFDENHVGLLLPETTVAGAWHVAQMICDAVGKHGERPLITMYTYPAASQGAKGSETVLRSNELQAEEKDLKKIAS